MILSSRQKEIILWMMGVFATVGLLLLLAIPLERAASRGPASIQSLQSILPGQEDSKEKILKGAMNDLPFEGKGSGSLKIAIASHAKNPMSAGSSAELEATVEALEDLENLQFNWLLPDGVSAVVGPTQGRLGRLSRGDKTTLNLTIISAVDDNKQVHLHVYRKVGDESMGEIAQFNTVLQDKIESEIEKRAEVLKAQAESGKELEDGSVLPQGMVQ